MYGFVDPLALLLLPLAVIPLVARNQSTVAYSSLAMLPPDRGSDIIDWALRVLAALSLIAIIVGIAGLFRSEQSVPRIGQGAQTVILIDSSGSMDTGFADANKARVAKWGTYISKGQIARQLLAQFAEQRPQDMFALFLFSGNPIPVLPLTAKQDVIQAAISAGTIERGLASTDLGTGLIRSLNFFEGKPFTGSRIVMLVSDGAAQLTIPVQDQIRNLLEKHRVTLYWIYLRSWNSPGLFKTIDVETAKQTAPEQLVHKFFAEMGLPYRAFSAENPKSLQEAIAAVDQLQNLPIRYMDIVPKQDLSGRCFAVALMLLAALTAAKLSELQRWH
jgi:mxaC protein